MILNNSKKLVVNTPIPKLQYRNTWRHTFTINIQIKLPPHLILRYAPLLLIPHE